MDFPRSTVEFYLISSVSSLLCETKIFMLSFSGAFIALGWTLLVSQSSKFGKRNANLIWYFLLTGTTFHIINVLSLVWESFREMNLDAPEAILNFIISIALLGFYVSLALELKAYIIEMDKEKFIKTS